MTHRFLAHYICGENGIVSRHLLTIDTETHTRQLSPYEKEVPSTRFIDGILLPVNKAFQEQKKSLLEALRDEHLDTLPLLAAYLARTEYLTSFCTPPLDRLYTLDTHNGEIYLQELLHL